MTAVITSGDFNYNVILKAYASLTSGTRTSCYSEGLFCMNDGKLGELMHLRSERGQRKETWTKRKKLEKHRTIAQKQSMSKE